MSLKKEGVPASRPGTPFVVKPVLLTYFSECCGCGLVHLEVLQVNADGSVTTYSYTDEHETEKVRRAEGIVLYRKKGGKNKPTKA